MECVDNDAGSHRCHKGNAACLCRDDVHHHGRRIDWGDWAVCSDDWHFGGTGALKTGASYHPAPGMYSPKANVALRSVPEFRLSATAHKFAVSFMLCRLALADALTAVLPLQDSQCKGVDW